MPVTGEALAGAGAVAERTGVITCGGMFHVTDGGVGGTRRAGAAGLDTSGLRESHIVTGVVAIGNVTDDLSAGIVGAGRLTPALLNAGTGFSNLGPGSAP